MFDAAAFDVAGLTEDLAMQGYAVRQLLDPEACRAMAGLYPRAELFRRKIVMEQHSYGRGEYQYFSYPLPDPVLAMRSALYPPLASIANGWQHSLGQDTSYPETHAAYLERCHAAGQTRPTPLLLQYGPDDFNCLHQDLYGELAFPLQVAILLSAPGEDFTGGEFVLTEQRVRAQSRAEVVALRQGEAVIFPVNHRPVQGARGTQKVVMRHGVSRVRSGRRHTLGIIFHDAK